MASRPMGIGVDMLTFVLIPSQLGSDSSERPAARIRLVEHHNQDHHRMGLAAPSNPLQRPSFLSVLRFKQNTVLRSFYL